MDFSLQTSPIGLVLTFCSHWIRLLVVRVFHKCRLLTWLPLNWIYCLWDSTAQGARSSHLCSQRKFAVVPWRSHFRSPRGTCSTQWILFRTSSVCSIGALPPVKGPFGEEVQDTGVSLRVLSHGPLQMSLHTFFWEKEYFMASCFFPPWTEERSQRRKDRRGSGLGCFSWNWFSPSYLTGWLEEGKGHDLNSWELESWLTWGMEALGPFSALPSRNQGSMLTALSHSNIPEWR